jgi:L-Ala-D/L-Glu epimerase
MNFLFIQTIELVPVSFPFKTVFATAAGHKQRTDNIQIFLKLSDGTIGKAEASSSIALARESQSNMRRILMELIPELRGKSLDDYKTLVATIWRVSRFHPTAAAAMECALLDAVARTRRQSLAALLGTHNVSIETDLTLSVGAPGVMAAQARAAGRRGFRKFKVKLAGIPKQDLERLQAVQSAVPKAQLVADGNQGFHLIQALELAQGMRRAGISVVFFEQLFARLDIKAMRTFRLRTHLPLFADESVLTVSDAIKLFEAEAADGINIKVAKSGLLGALDLIHIAQRFKKRLAIGCMEESKMGLAASVHLACGTGAFEWVDLDSFFLLNVPAPRGGFKTAGPKFSVRGIKSGIGL